MPDLCYSNVCPASRDAFCRQTGASIKNSRPSGRDFPNYSKTCSKPVCKMIFT